MVGAQVTETARGFAPARDGKSGALFFGVFFLCVLLPVSFDIGTLRITPLRLLLLVTFVPLLARMLSSTDGKATLPDWLMLLFGFWIMVSLTVIHGVERIPFAGITVVEMIGGYLIGRVCIRNALQHKTFFSVYFKVLLLLLPVVIYELGTGRAPILDLLGVNFGNAIEKRMGLNRAQVVFPHTILWGLFCAIAIGNFFYIYGGLKKTGGLRSSMALAMTYSSLSSGPFLAGLLQIALIVWGLVTKDRWKLLLILSIIGYIVIDVLSDRTPIQIIIEEFTFSSRSGWYRLNIWEYGTQSVMKHPIFGIGLNDWERPSWMFGSSVDNFWLLIAMRYGLPAAFFLTSSIAIMVLRIVRNPITEPQIRAMRIGYLVTMVGMFMTLTTVHIWEQAAVVMMTYIGMGSWLFSPAACSASSESETEASGERVLRYSRSHLRPAGQPPSLYARSQPDKSSP